MPAPDQGKEAGEIGRRKLGKCAPEIRLEKGKNLWRAASDDFELHPGVGANLAEQSDDGSKIHRAVAERDPLERSSPRVLEERGVADVGRGDVGAERFQRQKRIFE